MQPTHGLRARRQTGRGKLRMQLGHVLAELRQSPPHQPPQPALRQPFGQPVNRRDTLEMDRALRLLARLVGGRLNDFRFRMVDGARPERAGLAENHHFVADLENLLHERQVPPPAMQPRRAVFEHDLEYGLGLLAVVVGPERDDAPASGRRLMKLKFANGQQPPPVLVPSRRVVKQVADSEQAEPGKLGRPLRPNAGEAAQRRLQRLRGVTGRWHEGVLGTRA